MGDKDKIEKFSCKIEIQNKTTQKKRKWHLGGSVG